MWTECATMDGVRVISSSSSGYACGKGMSIDAVSRTPYVQSQHGAPLLRCSRGWIEGMLVGVRRSEANCLRRRGADCKRYGDANVAAERGRTNNASGRRFEIGKRWGRLPSPKTRINEALGGGSPTTNNPSCYYGLRRETLGQRDGNERWNSGPIEDRTELPQMGRAPRLLLLSAISSLCLALPWFSIDSSAAVAEVLDRLETRQERQEFVTITSDMQFNAMKSQLGVTNDTQSFHFSLADRENSGNEVASSGTAGVNFSLAEAPKTCEESYGFLPCSNSLGGNLSLMVAYGYCLLLAAQFISNGSELLLEVMNPGLLGGLLLPILGALPDALLILVSGVGGTAQEAQEEVMVGIGVLAGSIVMLLTIGWAGSLFAGRCDLSGAGGTAQDRTLTRSLDWTGTGVTTDEQTREGAWVMVLSALPFVLVQIPLLDGHPSEGPEAAVIGAVVCAIGIVAYSAYQILYPWLQQKRIGEARLAFMRSRALQSVEAYSGYHGDRDSAQVLKSNLRMVSWPTWKMLWFPLQLISSDSRVVFEESMQKKRRRLVEENSKRNLLGSSTASLKEIFSSFDTNEDGKIQRDELTGLLVGLGLEEEGSIPDTAHIQLWLQEFDVDMDGTLSEHEFKTGIVKWAEKISKEKWSKRLQKLGGSSHTSDNSRFWAAQSSEAKKVLDLLESEVEGEEDDEGNPDAESLDAGAVKRKAALFLAGGAALAAIFADPLVGSIGGFSTASGIPPFFVAFVVTPFASNASELVSSIIFAKGRKKKNISLTFSQLYGGVTMNNTLCLGIFLTLVYVRGLTWDFSSEVTVILISVVTMGALGGSRTTFPFWLALPVLAIYPFCISMVALLDNYLGWH